MKQVPADAELPSTSVHPALSDNTNIAVCAGLSKLSSAVQAAYRAVRTNCNALKQSIAALNVQ